MTKKILATVFAVATLLMIFAISASADLPNSKTWVEQDFTRPDDQLINPDWIPDNWKIAGRTSAGGTDNQNLGIYRVHEDGYVELAQGEYVGFASFTYNPPYIYKDYTFMIDVKFPTEDAVYTNKHGVICAINGYCVAVYANGQIPYRTSTGSGAMTSESLHDPDKWYTYAFVVKGDKMSAYRMAEGENVFSAVIEDTLMQTRNGNELWGMIAQGDAKMLIDNVKIFSGKSLVDSKIEFSEDKTKITGTLTVRNGDVTPGNSDNAMAVMMAYDKKGKILGMKYMQDIPVLFGDAETVPVEMNCSGFYEKLVGGTVELYLWDTMGSFKPLTEAYVASVQ